MKNEKDWKPLSEALKTIKIEDLIAQLKKGTIQARGNFETDQMYQDKEDGLLECDEDGNFPQNIQEIAANCWEIYKYNHSNHTLGRTTSTKHGTSGWYNYSDIEILYKPKLNRDEDEKTDSRISELHWEIGEAYDTLFKQHPDKSISATMVWNYLKKMPCDDTCILRFSRAEDDNQATIEWKSSNGAVQSLKRRTFDNIVSQYKTKKKSISI